MRDEQWSVAAAGCRQRLRAAAPSIAILCGPASDEDRAYYDRTRPDARSTCDLEAALRELGASRVDAVDITRVPGWLDRIDGIDLVIVNLHGSPGEDGTIQALLDARDVRFAGSGVEASIRALDKGATKELALALGVATPSHAVLVDGVLRAAPAIAAGRTRILKPLRGGSSLGVRLLADDEPLPTAGDWIVEEFLPGHDVTVTVCERGGRAAALPAIALSHRSPFYDAAAKLVADPSLKAVATRPEDLTEAFAACEASALRMHVAIGAAHVTRSDFVVHAGAAFYLETNTLPGLSWPSNVAECARAAGLDYLDLIALVAGAALADPRRALGRR